MPALVTARHKPKREDERTLHSDDFDGVMLATAGFVSAKYRSKVHPSVFEHMEITRSQVAEGNADEAAGYANAMLMGQRIRYAVDFGKTPKDQVPDAEAAVRDALGRWSEKLENEVAFVPTSWKEASVKIRFAPDVTLDGQIVSGYINWVRTIKKTTAGIRPQFSADIFLRTTDPKNRRLSFESMRHTCGHELGHMFGLDDSKRIGDLMGPLDVRRPVTSATKAEVETVKEIREEFKEMIAEARGTHACYFSQDRNICCAHHDHEEHKQHGFSTLHPHTHHHEANHELPLRSHAGHKDVPADHLD